MLLFYWILREFCCFPLFERHYLPFLGLAGYLLPSNEWETCVAARICHKQLRIPSHTQKHAICSCFTQYWGNFAVFRYLSDIICQYSAWLGNCCSQMNETHVVLLESAINNWGYHPILTKMRYDPVLQNIERILLLSAIWATLSAITRLGWEPTALEWLRHM